MATRYAVSSGDWSDASTVWSDTDGGAAGAYVPVDGDTFVILTAVSVKMDVDQSAWTGLAGNNIIRGGATPGMLYWSNGDTGYLKLRTGATLQGTTDTSRGRLLVNSDGVWATATGLQFSNKAVIDMQGTAQIQATNLDIKCYCTHPTNWFVRTYDTKYNFAGDTAVDPVNNIIDLGTTPPSAGTAVCVTTASGTLPVGLAEDTVYYVRAISGNTCKLARQNSDETIVDITADGSGTCSLITGHTNTGTATMNVLEDVTADTPWVTTDEYDRVVLVDCNAPGLYDQQRVQLTTINAGTIVLSANVDSAQYPGAKIFLSSRNVAIRSAGTSGSQGIVLYASQDVHGGVFDCEIINTAGSGTTFYGYGTSDGSGLTISGTVSGCSSGISTGSGHTISGTVSGCSNGIQYGSEHTISGTVSGCDYGIGSSSGHTISGTVSGNVYDFREYLTAVVANGGDIGVTPTWYDRNTAYQSQRVSCENFNKVLNAHKIFDAFGDVVRTACDGTGDAPSVDPDSGNGDCIEASNIQSNCSAGSPLVIFDKHRLWMTAAEHTITYKVQTTYAGIAAGNLKLTCEYLGTDNDRAIEVNASAISQRSGSTDWSQTLAVTITPNSAGWVTLKMELMEYEAGNEVYVWPAPVVS